MNKLETLVKFALSPETTAKLIHNGINKRIRIGGMKFKSRPKTSNQIENILNLIDKRKSPNWISKFEKNIQ